MAESSKEVDPVVDAEAKKEVIEEVKKQAAAEDDEEESGEDEPVGGAATGEPSTGDVGASSKAKKKKSKRAKIKKAIGLGGGEGSSAHPASKLTPEMVEQLLEMNPSLKGEVAGMDHAKAVEALKKMDVADLLTGMSVSGKNQKDMASYKFWQTQPVPRFDDSANASQGPIEMIDPAKVPKEPRPMVEGFDWVIMDLTDRKEVRTTIFSSRKLWLNISLD
jgi:glycylpeptide N-tetradecanoyltransferase